MDTFLARMWIRRRTVGTALAVVIALIVVIAGWQVWRANEAARAAEAIRIEVTETLPNALHQAGEAALVAATDPEALGPVDAT